MKEARASALTAFSSILRPISHTFNVSTKLHIPFRANQELPTVILLRFANKGYGDIGKNDGKDGDCERIPVCMLHFILLRIPGCELGTICNRKIVKYSTMSVYNWDSKNAHINPQINHPNVHRCNGDNSILKVDAKQQGMDFSCFSTDCDEQCRSSLWLLFVVGMSVPKNISNREITVKLLSNCFYYQQNPLNYLSSHPLDMNFHLTHHHLAGLEGAKATMLGKETPMMAT